MWNGYSVYTTARPFIFHFHSHAFGQNPLSLSIAYLSTYQLINYLLWCRFIVALLWTKQTSLTSYLLGFIQKPCSCYGWKSWLEPWPSLSLRLSPSWPVLIRSIFKRRILNNMPLQNAQGTIWDEYDGIYLTMTITTFAIKVQTDWVTSDCPSVLLLRVNTVTISFEPFSRCCQIPSRLTTC